MSRQEALITPSVLKWAREAAGYDISAAAVKLGRPESDIEKWEAGELLPSIAQARNVSKIYNRSLAVFYLPEPPEDFQTIRDFRHLYGNIPQEYSPKLLLLIRQVQIRQEWLQEWLQQEGGQPLDFIGSATLRMPIRTVANSIRQTLKMSTDQQKACSTRREALALWVNKAEGAGINICRQGGIDCNEARGFVLTDKYAPFIFINTNDSLAAQLFTLVHELAHIWLNSPGISNLEGLESVRTQEDNIEIFCNKITSEVLLEHDIFMKLWASRKTTLSTEDWIKTVSDAYKISESMIALKLLQNNLITLGAYTQLRDKYIEDWKKYRGEEKAKMKAKKSGPSPHLLKVHSNGYTYTQTVISAYSRGAVSGRDASGLLGVKINNLKKVAKYAAVNTGSWQ